MMALTVGDGRRKHVIQPRRRGKRRWDGRKPRRLIFDIQLPSHQHHGDEFRANLANYFIKPRGF